eukprot:evm.model.scf_520.6 EVM.evm.TU.scf_520.6   scf_520:61854-71225(+)
MDIAAAKARLHRLVLSWDYFELWDKREGGLVNDLKPVPDTFDSVEHYKEIYEPLVLEECSAQIVRGSVEGDYSECNEAVVAARDQQDPWLYVRMTTKADVQKGFGQNDLVLISKDHPDGANIRRELSTMGIAEAREGEQSVRVKLCLDVNAQRDSAQGLKRVCAVNKALETGSGWWMCKLCSLSTNIREWTALQLVNNIPFRDILLSAKPRSRRSDKVMEITKHMRAKMDKIYNASQIEALHAGLDGPPVVLVQGPPGTGKTHAILGLLSIVLHAARKGTLDVLDDSDDAAAGGMEFSKEDSARLWEKTAPWVLGLPVKRDEEPPYEDSDGEAEDVCCSLLQRELPVVVGGAKRRKGRVLICAPSNSALDELICRIITIGLMDKNGKSYTPNVVRVGVNAHHSVKSVELDTLVNQKLAKAERSGVHFFAELDRMRSTVVEEAEIVGSTLGFSGSSLFNRVSCKFDVVVIDEAAQAVEPATLIPLMRGCKQLYMIGDPVQLPATVISQRAGREYEYDKSLMKRLMSAGYPVHMLNVQYRMNPMISCFPSSEFYGGKLLDAESVSDETKSPLHSRPWLGPFAFYHVAGKESKDEGSTSRYNKSEIELILALFREIIKTVPDVQTRPAIAVISPYKAQVKKMREYLNKAYPEEFAQLVDINTIDGFQGRQKDITFFSTVRSKEMKAVGFVADEQRINVGITRARSSLIIVGNSQSLVKDERWSRLILMAKTKRCFYQPHRPYKDYLRRLLDGEEGPIEPTQEEIEMDKNPQRAEPSQFAGEANGEEPGERKGSAKERMQKSKRSAPPRRGRGGKKRRTG